jgi:hypothetical protein
VEWELQRRYFMSAKEGAAVLIAEFKKGLRGKLPKHVRAAAAAVGQPEMLAIGCWAVLPWIVTAFVQGWTGEVYSKFV